MMPDIKSRKWLFLITIMMAVAVLEYLYLSKKNARTFDAVCNAAFEVTHNHVGLTLPLNGTAVFRPDSTGIVELSGNTILNGKPERLSRTISFNYARENGDIFKLTNISEVSHAGDTFDNDFLNANFLSINPEHSKLMALARINNTIVIGNAYSPIFMCVEKP
ncbi:hypothetical protein RI049_18230 [Cedecea neteri]|uniref:hypothetical protein n=1 Tax=Cedecea neteri TaxID=158822 RepID=UPI002AA632E3|nr:hypothetical protein [Cedecea neteri]WPU21969.1 hypothetical protein RI049_18230 [Cedecea neteri]